MLAFSFVFHTRILRAKPTKILLSVKSWITYSTKLLPYKMFSIFTIIQEKIYILLERKVCEVAVLLLEQQLC